MIATTFMVQATQEVRAEGKLVLTRSRPSGQHSGRKKEKVLETQRSKVLLTEY